MAADARNTPGGTWTLAVPYLELTDYQSATQGGSRAVRWFFANDRNDWVLMVQDDLTSDVMLTAQRCG
jgi:hypothetical protein